MVNQQSGEAATGGLVPRRHLLVSLLAAGLLRPHPAPAGPQSKSKESQLPVHVSTLNHVSFGCADLKSTVRWYGRVLGKIGRASCRERGASGLGGGCSREESTSTG